MDYFLKLDWSGTFAPQLTLPEVLLRGTVIYMALLVLLRVIPKWQAGTGSIASMLFVVLLGNIAAGGIVGKTESVTDIILLITTVTVWVIVVDWLSCHLPWFHFLAQDSPTTLIRDGHMLDNNLRQEMISEDDLKTQLRRHDVDDIADVHEAILEADGSISIVKKKEQAGKATTANHGFSG